MLSKMEIVKNNLIRLSAPVSMQQQRHLCPINTYIMQHIWKCYNSGGLSSWEPHTSLLPQLFLSLYVKLLNDFWVTSMCLQLEFLKHDTQASKKKLIPDAW